MNTTISEWRSRATNYIKGECSSEEAAAWEALMLSNDDVLEVYMQVMSEMDSELPVMNHPETFVDRVLSNETIVPYRSQLVPISLDRPRRWYEKSVFHYTVAASITLVLMFSGAFDRLFPEGKNPKAELSSSPSYSEQLMEKTTNWLDQLKP